MMYEKAAEHYLDVLRDKYGSTDDRLKAYSILHVLLPALKDNPKFNTYSREFHSYDAWVSEHLDTFS